MRRETSRRGYSATAFSGCKTGAGRRARKRPRPLSPRLHVKEVVAGPKRGTVGGDASRLVRLHLRRHARRVASTLPRENGPMSKKLNRRDFLIAGAGAGLAATAPRSLFGEAPAVIASPAAPPVVISSA